ncbi:MAG: hypothetical protein ACRD0Y_05650 [Terriglobales bacterium]
MQIARHGGERFAGGPKPPVDRLDGRQKTQINPDYATAAEVVLERPRYDIIVGRETGRSYSKNSVGVASFGRLRAAFPGVKAAGGTVGGATAELFLL